MLARVSSILIRNGKQDLSFLRHFGDLKEAEHKNLALGLRRSSPPDSVIPSKMRLMGPPKHNPNEEISDAEWEIRTSAFITTVFLRLWLFSDHLKRKDTVHFARNSS